MHRLCVFGGLVALLALAAPARSQSPGPLDEPTLYVVGYAHLDTQWRWTYPKVIREFIPNTMHTNFGYFGKYPNYIFNFSGSNRYRMMKEYYPDDYETVKQYVNAGQWFPCGSSVEECDVNVPSAESLIRQVLYGNQFFRHELGIASDEFMLPDCFGFPASLPSLLAHCGLKGFSTQKLTWGSAVGIPFNVGVWRGLDGTELIAAFNPGSYGSSISNNLSTDSGWLQRINANGSASGVYADYMYFGTGDVGGGPSESSVQWLETSVAGSGPVNVISSKADQMFLDIPASSLNNLPHYQGDLLLTQHSAGSITSQGYMKRWNHKNELLADAAERAAVLADWMGAFDYPRQRLNDAWTLVMGGQFHDILPGTSHPKAYEYSWNDEILAMNQFAGVLDSAVGAIASTLDTQAAGVPVVVYNPLSVAREDVVQAEVRWPTLPLPAAVRVVGPDGAEVPSQITGSSQGSIDVLFLATVPSVGFAVYDVQAAVAPAASTLAVTTSSLENARYRITLDGNGDVSNIYDKQAGRLMLASPARLAFSHDFPSDWPAWNMDWSDAQQPPQAYVTAPKTARIVENGAARVALEITRDAEGSHFVQTIRLAAGDAGNRIEFANTIDWRSQVCNLKAVFPLGVSNPNATYNWEVGTIQRGNNSASKYEVPTHQWIDLTDSSGAYGTMLLTHSKYGSDKPDSRTLRLTLLRTPGAGNGYQDQATQDWGRHEILYGLAGHVGGWRTAQTDWQAMRMSQPLVAFQTTPHTGPLGASFSLLGVNNPRVRLMAMKMAEESDEIIVRLVELNGQTAANVHVSLPSPIVSARELDGQERQIGPATVSNGELVTDLGGYRLRTFALTLGSPPTAVASVPMQSVALPFTHSVTSNDGQTGASGFDSAGRSLPAEMLPAEIPYRGITFELGPVGGGQLNAARCAGQVLQLPAGNWNRIYLLAAADSEVQAPFMFDGIPVPLTIQGWGGYVGQWDNRIWGGSVAEEAFSWPWPVIGLAPGYIRPDPVAWYCSHRHTSAGRNEYYAYCYLFAYAVDLPGGAATLTLPESDRICLMAVTMANDPSVGTFPAQPLLDELIRDEVRTQVMRPIAASGWNRDIIVERTASPPYASFAASFDVPNQYAYYERGLGSSAKGLPQDRAFISVSDGVTEGLLQPYDGPNVLFLNADNPSGTLVFAPVSQMRYRSLAVFAASANAPQDSTGAMTITFTDGSSSAPLPYNAYDWFFATANNAVYDLGRVRLGSNGFEDGSDGNPRIYQTTIDLEVLGLHSQDIYSLTFERGSGSGAGRSTAIFAVSGAAISYPGDLNGDTFSNADDMAIFEGCLTNPDVLYDPVALPASCPVLADAQGIIAADFDRDGDVDQSDFGVLQRCIQGVGVPVDPSCAD